jgi:hypothetical protein
MISVELHAAVRSRLASTVPTWGAIVPRVGMANLPADPG